MPLGVIVVSEGMVKNETTAMNYTGKLASRDLSVQSLAALAVPTLQAF